MSDYCILFSQTFYGLLFSYLTITDVTSYVHPKFPVYFVLYITTKKINTVNSSANAPITQKITLARFVCLCFSLPFCLLFPLEIKKLESLYHKDSTMSRPLNKVKPCSTGLVLGDQIRIPWVVITSFSLVFFFFFPFPFQCDIKARRTPMYLIQFVRHFALSEFTCHIQKY